MNQIGFFKKIMLLFIGQRLILPGSNPKKSMFYLGHRLSPNLNSVGNMWELLARKVYSEGMQFRTKE